MVVITFFHINMWMNKVVLRRFWKFFPFKICLSWNAQLSGAPVFSHEIFMQFVFHLCVLLRYTAVDFWFNLLERNLQPYSFVIFKNIEGIVLQNWQLFYFKAHNLVKSSNRTIFHICWKYPLCLCYSSENLKMKIKSFIA